MKRIIWLLVILSSLSCTKEKGPDSIIGKWNLTEITTGPSIFLSGTELSVEFKEDGDLLILGPKSNYTSLQDFNQYEMVGVDRIRFFNKNNQEELFAVYSLDKTLSLLYEVRCLYQEKFTRR
jgi:hypothetical protein